MISILDIGIGNINSVEKALKYIKAEYNVISEPNQLYECKKILFPGVGNFKRASEILDSNGFREIIRMKILEDKIPFLGICLGMQLLATKGYESGCSRGLDLIDAEVVKIPEKKGLRVPHMGWNEVSNDNSSLFSGLPHQTDFYFVHSYYMKVNDPRVKQFKTNHGEEITAFVHKENIYGAQFHPEKSQKNGLKILDNFDKLC